MRNPLLVWQLLGGKAGDNQQIRAVAEALAWPSEERHLVFRNYELLSNLTLGVTLAGMDVQRSDVLQAPWPDLIITAGRRNEPVARWIQAQSGGKAKIVHLGRPWAALKHFDLIVSTPQYALPSGDNILQLAQPLHNVNAERLQTAAREWASKFADLPTPRTAVLLGGDSGQYVFTPEKARRLGRLVNQRAAQQDGSLLVTDSARTPPAAREAFMAELDAPHFYFKWGASAAAENPYFAYLALADELVVTGESMSMLTEACATNKPVFIFDLADIGAKPWWRYRHNWRWKPVSHHAAMRWAPRRMRRNIGNIQYALVNSGRASWFDERTWQQPACSGTQAISDVQPVVKRIRSLFE